MQKRPTTWAEGGAAPLRRSLLENAITHLGLSSRAYDHILKVSRTLADLEGKENIEPGHVSEAIQYRYARSKFLGVMYKSETLIYCSAQEKAFIAEVPRVTGHGPT
jgi:hypothetical protein